MPVPVEDGQSKLHGRKRHPENGPTEKTAERSCTRC